MIAPWFRWHPEVALRYLPVVDIIRKLPNPTVLEVGSGSLGIAPYLKKPVTGLDISFEGPTVDWLQKVQGKVQGIPFQDTSFDAVIAMDVLEHLPERDRATAVFECIRVARTLVVIGGPTGKAADAEDLLLSQEYEHVYKASHPFFVDHIRYGVPSRAEMNSWIADALAKQKKRAHIKQQRNESIWLHRFLMRGWMTRSPLVAIFFRKLLLVFLPLLRLWNNPPTYRTLFFVTLEH